MTEFELELLVSLDKIIKPLERIASQLDMLENICVALESMDSKLEDKGT